MFLAQQHSTRIKDKWLSRMSMPVAAVDRDRRHNPAILVPIIKICIVLARSGQLHFIAKFISKSC